MDCEACSIAATDPTTGRYDFPCDACQTRQIAKAPKHLRDAFYAKVLDTDERFALIAAVNAERKRLRGEK